MQTALKRLVTELTALGIRKNGVLLVHSSLRSLGKIDNVAETLIRALIAVLGEDGTLLLPALSFATVGEWQPHFNQLSTPSCIGALPEYFRQRDGTIRSIHPTHSVCGIGKYAQEILHSHQHDQTPCGLNSPFHRLRRYNAQVLFIGCGLKPNTSMHAIEELSEPPYLYGEIVEYEITDVKGHVFTMAVRSHHFKGWVQRYDRLGQLLDNHTCHIGKVLDAQCHLIEVDAMWQVAHEKLKRDPLFFVDKDSQDA